VFENATEVKKKGILNLNGEFPLVNEQLEYIADKSKNSTWDWGGQTFRHWIAELKNQSSVKRLWLSVGSSSPTSFHTIQDMYNKLPLPKRFGPDTKLYQAFDVLIRNLPEIDGFDLDNEELSSTKTSTIAFANMITTLGKDISICPYGGGSVWNDVAGEANVSRINYQAYAGGGDPCGFISPSDMHLLNLPLNVGLSIKGPRPGCSGTCRFLWFCDRCSPQPVARTFASYVSERQCAQQVTGVWFWIYGAISDPHPKYPLKQYVDAFKAAAFGHIREEGALLF